MDTQSVNSQLLELEATIQAISRGKIMWEATFDVISDPVMIINHNYQIKRANSALAKVSGLDIKRTVGQTCYQVFAGFTNPCPQCPVKNLKATTEVVKNVRLPEFKHKKTYDVNAYALSSEKTHESEPEVVLHYRDVTETARLQHKLMHVEKMAAVGTLAGGVAHEINNPLGAALAFVQLSLRHLQKQQPVLQEDLLEAENAILRCKKIVRDLLDFSRQNPDVGQTNIDLVALIEKSLSVFKMTLKATDIELEFHPPSQPLRVIADASQIQQVFLNLMTNAWHAVETTSKKSIQVYLEREGNSQVVIRVKDSGTGIKPENLLRIFDPFFTTKDPGVGTGLGLAICYRIIEEHQGRLEVVSSLGQGAEFLVYLPMKEG